MSSYRKELHYNLTRRRGLVNITRDVEKVLAESGIKEGLILINAMNITASGNRSSILNLMENGTSGYLSKSLVSKVI